MPRVKDPYSIPSELLLGQRLNDRVPATDQQRQRGEVEVLLKRLRKQPGVVLADEVGMGKTFVALAVAYSVAISSPRGPVVAMVPANMVDKWEQDLRAFCGLYLENRRTVRREAATPAELRDPAVIRTGVARRSLELMKLLDDEPRNRCHIIFLTHGAMGGKQTDKWVRLALIAEALRRHGRGGAKRLIQVKAQIHRFLAELLWAIGEEKGNNLGEELWQHLLRTHPSAWKEIYNGASRADRQLQDEPVPKAVIRNLGNVNLDKLADALKEMPVRARGGDERVSERIKAVREALREVEGKLWQELLAKARWRSPLLVMDEAHHLKNPGTNLARQLQSVDRYEDLRTGDGAMARAFDRMLFLTATPFQLGHHELVRVLDRFGDVRWEESELGAQADFKARMKALGERLDDSQRASIALQRSWSQLTAEEIRQPVDAWWSEVRASPKESLPRRVRAVTDAFDAAKKARDAAASVLKPWVLRHNKGDIWAGTSLSRRERIEGGFARDVLGGLKIPPVQLLPFFLAARSASSGTKDVLGEALCSSYEAFRYTRENRDPDRDEDEDEGDVEPVDLSNSGWYLGEFDRAIDLMTGAEHPKVSATVKRVVDLWETGEKVLVFAFYRRTCAALRLHISREIERRLLDTARARLAAEEVPSREIQKILIGVQRRFFDKVGTPGRRALDTALKGVLGSRAQSLDRAGIPPDQREVVLDIMRRFLRVETTLVRSFPLEAADGDPAAAVTRMLDYADASGVSWRRKFEWFIEFISERCTSEERALYIEAAVRTQTGDIGVADEDDQPGAGRSRTTTLANVQVATGKTNRDARTRLMRAFNTPFFPDILVCSEVMGEGVDLHRFCSHVIHHDLAWNPSTIEQRTGRIDRLGCKAEGRQAISVYLPFLAGAADERQFRVMSDRERWFQVVMGQDEVAKLIRPDAESGFPLPQAVTDELAFELS